MPSPPIAAAVAVVVAVVVAAVLAVTGLGRRCKHGERPALELVKDQKGREQEQDHQDQDQGQAAPLQEERAAVLLGGALYELLNAEAFFTYN